MAKTSKEDKQSFQNITIHVLEVPM